MVHCEGYDAIRYLTERLEQAGETAPFYHGVSRPQVVEREAAHRAISHAELVDVPIMIVHVSGRRGDGADALGAAARAEGPCRNLPAIHHADGRRHEGPQHGHQRARNMSARRRRAMRRARRRSGKVSRAGVFQTFSSDHCPFRYDDPQGKLTPKARTSFRWVPNGIPGIETRLPILFSEGVSKGRISLQKFVALTVDQSRAASMASIPARARSASASMPTSCCGIRTAGRRSVRRSASRRRLHALGGIRGHGLAGHDDRARAGRRRPRPDRRRQGRRRNPEARQVEPDLISSQPV